MMIQSSVSLLVGAVPNVNVIPVVALLTDTVVSQLVVTETAYFVSGSAFGNVAV